MEMKKSYSPFGSTPLSVDEVLPDIQTGRAVYPDKDKEADASYMERINQYKHEGFHDVSEDGGGSGGGSSSGGGGGTAPLIISDTEETVQDPGSHTYYLTDTLATDAYEAWQSGRPIYRSVNGDMWAVSRVTDDLVITLYWDADNDGTAKERILATPFSDGYLCVPEGSGN